jgi:hypothetical protein
MSAGPVRTDRVQARRAQRQARTPGGLGPMSQSTMPTNSRIATVVSPAPRTAWNEAVASDPAALISQSPTWTDAAGAGGGDTHATRQYEFDDGERMVLPLLRRRAIASSLPDGLGMGGLVGAARTPATVAAVLEDLRDLGALSVRIRPNPVEADVWGAALPAGATTVARRAHVLDLRVGPDELWANLHKSTRRSVRKAEKSGLEVICDTEGALLDEFDHLYGLSVQRWARGQNEPLLLARWRNRGRGSAEELRSRAQALGRQFRLWVARQDGEPAAAIIVLVGAVAHYTKGATNRELAGPTRANHLLQWSAMQDSMAEGCLTYHMGDTGSSDSLARFKESFGAEPIDYQEIRLERLPLTGADRRVRGAVKRIVGFREA